MAWHGPPGRQLYYEDSGRGDAVVLMPGWGGSIADLTRLRRDLADGFRVIAVDLPGSGRSQPQPRQPASISISRPYRKPSSGRKTIVFEEQI